MGAITLEGVEKWFGDAQVIKGIDLEIEEGEFVVFVGPSGCGKSTLLRLISGLEEAERGRIFIDGRDVTAEPPSGRELAMVFQSYALYPHMTVENNMGFALKTAGAPRPEIGDKVAEAASILKLEPLLERRPRELSGGQRQRVAIGRAIVRKPVAFLFDEPLSNLDAALRADMRMEIARLHRELGATMIYVTHDQIEAMTLADRIVVMNGGRIEQVGAPRDLYHAPANRFVAQFIGSPKMNVLSATNGDGEPFPGAAGVEGAAKIGIRPEHIRPAHAGAELAVTANLQWLEFVGADTLAHLATGFGDLVARFGSDYHAEIGSEVQVGFERERLYCFDGNDRLIPSRT